MREILLLIALVCVSVFIRNIFTHEDHSVTEVSTKKWTEINFLQDIIDGQPKCASDPDTEYCKNIPLFVEDLNISLVSCKADDRSSLCKALIRASQVEKYSGIFHMTSGVEAVALPHSPFYINLPTKTFQEFDEASNYRGESISWFWDKWTYQIVLAMAALTVLIVLGVWHLVKKGMPKLKAVFTEKEPEKCEVQYTYPEQSQGPVSDPRGLNIEGHIDQDIHEEEDWEQMILLEKNAREMEKDENERRRLEKIERAEKEKRDFEEKIDSLFFPESLKNKDSEKNQ